MLVAVAPGEEAGWVLCGEHGCFSPAVTPLAASMSPVREVPWMKCLPDFFPQTCVLIYLRVLKWAVFPGDAGRQSPRSGPLHRVALTGFCSGSWTLFGWRGVRNYWCHKDLTRWPCPVAL